MNRPTTQSIALSGIAIGLPRQTELVEDILARNGSHPSMRWLFTKMFDLHQSPTLGPGESLENLLVDVGRRALNGGRVQLIVYGHTILYQMISFRPGFANRIRAALDLPGVPFFGLSHVACTSVLHSVEVARRYLDRPDATADDRVLVLGGDHVSAFDSTRMIPMTAVQGDATVAFLVQKGAGRYRYLGGAACRDLRFHRSMRMNTEEIRLFASVCFDHMLAAITGALDAARATVEDIDWVMPHLCNTQFWRTFSKRTGIPQERILLDLIPEQGHTSGIDALASLDHADRTGRLTPGQRCVLVSIGQGAYFRATVIEVTEG